MVALKASDVDRFIARPDPARPIVLVFGPDSGLVRERTQALIESSVDDPSDPFSLARLDGDDLAGEPSRLVEEANTVPLFGGRRAVWVKAGGRNFAAAVEAVVASPPTDCRIVIEAGDLRRNAPVRAICEKAKCAAVLPCYIDTERDLIRLVDDEMRDARLSIAPDARAALDDVLAVVADASALALDAVVDAAFAGRASETEAQFSKALSAGTSSGTIMSWALRYVTQLHKARVALDAGEDSYAAMRSFIPPIHFRREATVQTA